jgi:DNA-binding MarR family transcriptional regulator
MHLLRYCAFVLIGANPGISLIALARYIVIDKSRVSELIDSMEREDLIERRRMSEDHRSQGLYLTPNGIARLAMVSQDVEVHEQKIQELYSPDERQQLIALLSRIHA